MFKKLVYSMLILVLTYIVVHGDYEVSSGSQISRIRTGNNQASDFIKVLTTSDNWLTIHKADLPSETRYLTILSMLLSAKANGNSVTFYSKWDGTTGKNHVTWIDMK